MPFDLDLGNAATDRSGTGNLAGYTDIDLFNTANVDGVITQIEVWMRVTGTLRVGSFFLVSGTTYQCRDSANLGSIAAGSKVTKTVDSGGNPLKIAVKAGDFIGWYSADGSLEYAISGGSGWRYYLGEAIDPGEQASYSLAAGYAGSCYGQGVVPNRVLTVV